MKRVLLFLLLHLQVCFSMEITTGTYRGISNAASRKIYSGFDSDVLMIFGLDETPCWSNINSDTTLTFNTGFSSSLITAMDDTSFTVGTGNEVNKNGTSYIWIGIKDTSDSDFMYGSYVGTGAIDTISCNFQADLCIIKSCSAAEAAFRTSENDSGYSMRFDWDTNKTNEIIEFLSNGFVVGTSSSVNSNGIIYYYFLLKESTNKFEVGTYTGNEANGRIIDTSFKPGCIWGRMSDNSSSTWMTYRMMEAPITSENCYTFNGNLLGTTFIDCIGCSGDNANFEVDADLNTSSKTYIYCNFYSVKDLSTLVCVPTTVPYLLNSKLGCSGKIYGENFSAGCAINNADSIIYVFSTSDSKMKAYPMTAEYTNADSSLYAEPGTAHSTTKAVVVDANNNVWAAALGTNGKYVYKYSRDLSSRSSWTLGILDAISFNLSLDGNYFYIGARDESGAYENLEKYDANDWGSSELWKVPFTDIFDIFPLYDGNIIIYDNGNLKKIDVSDGSTDWTTTVGLYRSICVSYENEKIFTRNTSYSGYAQINIDTGSIEAITTNVFGSTDYGVLMPLVNNTDCLVAQLSNRICCIDISSSWPNDSSQTFMPDSLSTQYPVSPVTGTYQQCFGDFTGYMNYQMNNQTSSSSPKKRSRILITH